MAYDILITQNAKKQLAKIDKQVARRITKKLREISGNPFPFVTRLVGIDLYKLRIGNYRVLMSIQQEKMIIMIVEVSHRRNVYK